MFYNCPDSVETNLNIRYKAYDVPEKKYPKKIEKIGRVSVYLATPHMMITPTDI